MPEYLSGPEQHVTDFKRLLRRIYRAGFGIDGSVGRLALFADAGLETPPLAVSWREDYPLSPRYYRDVDIITGRGNDDLEAIIALARRTKHHIDATLNPYFDIPGSNLVFKRLAGQRVQKVVLPVNPAALQFRDRNLGGVPVRTFPCGTMYEIAQWGAKHPYNPEKYAQVIEYMAPLMERMHIERPDEFLPPEAYAPFRQYTEDAALF